MTSALVSNNAVVDFYLGDVPNPILIVDGGGVSHAVYCATVGWIGVDATEGYSILPAAMDSPPDQTSYPSNDPQTYAISNGEVQVTRTWITPTPVTSIPQRITNAQARCWFYSNNLLDQVQAAATAAGGTTLLRWEYGNVFERNHPDTIAIIQAIGKTDAEADQMFVEAAGL